MVPSFGHLYDYRVIRTGTGVGASGLLGGSRHWGNALAKVLEGSHGGNNGQHYKPQQPRE